MQCNLQYAKDTAEEMQQTLFNQLHSSKALQSKYTKNVELLSPLACYRGTVTDAEDYFYLFIMKSRKPNTTNKSFAIQMAGTEGFNNLSIISRIQQAQKLYLYHQVSF